MRTVFSLQGLNDRTNGARRRAFRPRVEVLEDRWCPTGPSMEWDDPLDPTFGTGGVARSRTSAPLTGPWSM